MSLRAWRRNQGVAAGILARRWGIAKSTMYRYELPPEDAGARIPDRRVMGLIWLASEGAVGPESFYYLPDPLTGAYPPPEIAGGNS